MLPSQQEVCEGSEETICLGIAVLNVEGRVMALINCRGNC